MKNQALFSSKDMQLVKVFSIFGHALTLLHPDRPKLYTILAFLSAIGLISCSLYRRDSLREQDFLNL